MIAIRKRQKKDVLQLLFLSLRETLQVDQLPKHGMYKLRPFLV